ncbi:hypothetical protein AAW30_01863 [Arcobacter porcinus]|uniref:hypothetical protein n=1 Tax=Arcobacter porcinus TaxID=1935204 RepID=UPI000825AE5E|nr:hypothetical protein [Arcobacter porcinus]OCL81564.1 hypothetical protein AAW30_01863 [Arcobacter porcinus]
MNEYTSKSNIKEEIQKPNFLKHLFNYKYYIFTFVIALLYSIDYHVTGVVPTNQSLLLVIAIISAIKFKSNIIKRFLMFIAMLITTIIFTLIIFILCSYILDKINENNSIINNFLEMNNKTPIIIDEEKSIIKISSTSNKNITMHVKLRNYTKDEILEDYKNNITLFEEDMLINELELSCNQENIKKILSSGINMEEIFFDKNENIIGIISIDKNKCDNFLKSR